MDLTPVERETLVHLLESGDSTPHMIARGIDRRVSGVARRLNDLVDRELVIRKGSGVYALTVDGVWTALDVRGQ